MDGEILFSDSGRFAAIKDLVDADLKDRAQWYDRAVKNRTERFKRINTVKPMYEGAPNLVNPIIADLIRETRGRRAEDGRRWAIGNRQWAIRNRQVAE